MNWHNFRGGSSVLCKAAPLLIGFRSKTKDFVPHIITLAHFKRVSLYREVNKKPRNVVPFVKIVQIMEDTATNDVILTSTRSDDVASTLIRRYFEVERIMESTVKLEK